MAYPPLYLLALLPLLSILWMLLQGRVPVSARIQTIAAYHRSSPLPLLHPVALAPADVRHRSWTLAADASRWQVA